MTDPRLCIIGAGGLSSSRIYPYIGAAEAQLVGVCDLDAGRAERNARRFGGRPYSNVDAMLDAERPDGVIVCIAPAAHAQLATQILRRGIPVYTEKPPAPSAAEALAVARVAKETGVLCMTAFKKRYNRAYTRAKAWLAGFDPADHYSISLDYASAAYTNGEDHRSQFLLDFCVHGIDLVSFLFGDVERVFAFTRDRHAYAVSLRFTSGAVGSMNLTDGRSFGLPTEEVELTVRGGHWMTIHNSATWRIAAAEKAVEWREPPTFISAGDSGHDTGHLSEIVAFVKAIRDRRTDVPSHIAESYKTLVLYEAIAQSSATGEVVKVKYESM